MNFLRFLISKRFLINLAVIFILSFIVVKGTLVALNVYTRHGDEFSVPDFTGMELSEVRKIVGEKNFRFEIIDSIYNSDHEPGTVFEQNPPPGFNIKENRKIFITIIAFNPEKIAMPDLVGASIIQAMADIYAYGLKIGKLKYISDISQHEVLKQKVNDEEIDPGTSVIKGTIVDLIVGRGEEENKTTVPNIIGLTKEAARQKLAESYLNIGFPFYDSTVVSNKDTIESLIFRQYQRASEEIEVDYGAYIDIWLTADKIEAAARKYVQSNPEPEETLIEQDSI